MKGKWEYLVTSPDLPGNTHSPVMDHPQMTNWLNDMDKRGWELVAYGETHWHNQGVPQEWWVFRRPHGES